MYMHYISDVKTFSAAGHILAPKNLAGLCQHRILVTAGGDDGMSEQRTGRLATRQVKASASFLLPRALTRASHDE